VVALAILAATIASGSQQTAGHGRGALLAFIAGLLLTFIAVRVHTRLIRARISWWFGDIAPGGKHIHHVVFGVILMAGAGLLEFGLRPTGILLNVIAFIFGAGVALTLDEFALLLNVEDVYWLEEGRRSVDAVVVAVAAALLLLLGTVPIVGRIASGASDTLLAVIIVWNLTFSLITLSKGKLWTGFIGLVVPMLSVVGSVRLARPGSPWARWRYRTRPARLERAEARFAEEGERRKAWRIWTYDLVAGRPSLPRLRRVRRNDTKR
jgi:lysyl-tRNA synthetase class 2